MKTKRKINFIRQRRTEKTAAEAKAIVGSTRPFTGRKKVAIRGLSVYGMVVSNG